MSLGFPFVAEGTPLSMSTPVRVARSTKAALTRHHGESDPRTQAADTELRTALLERSIREAVEKAPPLSPGQRDRLALLLRGTAA